METPPAELESVLDEQGCLNVDVPCRACGYNLRGLPWSGHCPECGLPVGRSTYGDLLQFCDPAWLERLRRGVTVILWGALALVLALVVGRVLAITLRLPIIYPLVTLGASILTLYGTWLVTEPDPSGLGEREYGTLRRLARAALLIGLLGTLAMTALTIALHPAVILGLVCVNTLGGIGGAIGEYAKFFYLSKLAVRIPDPALSRRAAMLRFGVGIPMLIDALLVGLAMFVAYILTGTTPGATGLVPCLVLPVRAVTLVFWIISLVLLFQLRSRFRDLHLFASEFWSRDSGDDPPANPLRPSDAPWS